MMLNKLIKGNWPACNFPNFIGISRIHRCIIFRNEFANEDSDNQLIPDERSSLKSKAPPKQPYRPYLRFYVKYRSTFFAKYPDVEHNELNRRMGMVWHQLSRESKSQYFESYAREVDLYFDDALNFRTHRGDAYLASLRGKAERIKARNEAKRARLLRRYFRPPKKPLSPFWMYVKENNEKINLSTTEGIQVVKEGAAKWRNLSDVKKQKYYEEYNQKLVIHQSLMVDWEQEIVESGFSFLLPESKRFDLQPTNVRYRKISEVRRNDCTPLKLEDENKDEVD